MSKFKEGEYIALTLHFVPKFEPDAEIGQKGVFFKGLYDCARILSFNENKFEVGLVEVYDINILQ